MATASSIAHVSVFCAFVYIWLLVKWCRSVWCVAFSGPMILMKSCNVAGHHFQILQRVQVWDLRKDNPCRFYICVWYKPISESFKNFIILLCELGWRERKSWQRELGGWVEWQVFPFVTLKKRWVTESPSELCLSLSAHLLEHCKCSAVRYQGKIPAMQVP